jgi:predicted aspartyl protease
MITGQVTAFHEATVYIEVRGARGISRIVEAVVDTGFTGTMTLSAVRIAELALDYVETTDAILADGSVIAARAYSARVLWDGQMRRTKIYEADGGALVGMTLLHGFRLCMDIVDGGEVTIERMS